jgi:hypothetical protein
MPPVTVTPWRETRSAASFGPVCPQLLPDTRNESLALQTMGRGRFRALRNLKPILSNQSEDCLYLNVYAPVSGKSVSSIKFCYLGSGTDVMIFKIFPPNKSAKKLVFLTQNTAEFCKKTWFIASVFKKNDNFLQKMGDNPLLLLFHYLKLPF